MSKHRTLPRIHACFLQVGLPVLLAAALTAMRTIPTDAADLIVSLNEGKFVRAAGQATYPASPPAPDSLVVLDAEQSPPKVVGTLEGIEHTIQGPPQSIAITSDGTLAILGSPTRRENGQNIYGKFLQIIDLQSSPPRLIDRVDIGGHANGVAINSAGTLVLASTIDGTVKVLRLHDKKLSMLKSIKLSDRRLGSVTFTHDGKAAVVGLRDAGGLATLSVGGDEVADTNERVSTGLSPYSIDISSDGKWAVVSNLGLAGTANFQFNTSVSDSDSLTLVDMSRRPFRAVQFITVASTPEGAAISPDGRWIVVQAVNGSILPPANPNHNRLGLVQLFEIRNGRAEFVNELPGGETAQGIAFAKNSKTIIVQFNVEKALAVYAVSNDRLVDTGVRLPLAAGPGSIRGAPR